MDFEAGVFRVLRSSSVEDCNWRDALSIEEDSGINGDRDAGGRPDGRRWP